MRVRLSSEGKLYTCLFATAGHDLKKHIRAGKTDDEIIEKIKHLWENRDDRYSEYRRASPVHLVKKIEMSYIGG